MSGYLPFGGAPFGGAGTAGPTGAPNLLLKSSDSALDDDSEYFQGFVKTKAYTPGGIGDLKSTPMQPTLSARSLSAVNLSFLFDRDFGAEVSEFATASLTPAGAEVAVMPMFESATIADASALQFQLGDEALQQGAWSLERLVVPITTDGDR